MPLIILAILLLVFLYLISPSLRRHPDREVMKGLKIAHRGLHDNSSDAPENSMAAFRDALDGGYGIELGIPTRMKNLNVYAWIEPYVHQNQAELVNNLCMLVNSQLLSRDTGCQLSGYGENNEFDKIVREYKEIQAHDLLNDLGNNTSPYADTNATGNNESETAAE